jgi:hypothetical protein
MLRSHAGQGPQNNQVQRSLEELDYILFFTRHPSSRPSDRIAEFTCLSSERRALPIEGTGFHEHQLSNRIYREVLVPWVETGQRRSGRRAFPARGFSCSTLFTAVHAQSLVTRMARCTNQGVVTWSISLPRVRLHTIRTGGVTYRATIMMKPDESSSPVERKDVERSKTMGPPHGRGAGAFAANDRNPATLPEKVFKHTRTKQLNQLKIVDVERFFVFLGKEGWTRAGIRGTAHYL